MTNWTDEQAMRFIVWDPRNGEPRRDDRDGSIISDGILGRIGPSNVYLRTYAKYPDDKRPLTLAIGERIQGVEYSLSGSKGTYDVWRVS